RCTTSRTQFVWPRRPVSTRGCPSTTTGLLRDVLSNPYLSSFPSPCSPTFFKITSVFCNMQFPSYSLHT
ncbi:hypothetical protein M405DRAFT_825020, partial [Rhizopogon salebrosus TDB-379]